MDERVVIWTIQVHNSRLDIHEEMRMAPCLYKAIAHRIRNTSVFSTKLAAVTKAD